MSSSVVVVVVTYNSASLLPDFFASLQLGAVGARIDQIIVADNASTDDSIGVVRNLRPDATIVELDSNRGYAAGINAAVAASGRVDAVLVLNDDIRLRPGAIVSLVDLLETGSVGIAVPRLVDRGGELLFSQRLEPTLRTVFAEAVLGGRRAGSYSGLSEVVRDPSAYERELDVTWASGCAWLIAGECWEAVGQWDETLFLYGEDLDYALRTRDAGFRIRYTPDAEAVHLVGPSKRDPRLWSMSIWNRYRVFRRRHGPIRSSMFWFGLVVNEAIRSGRRGSIHRAGLAALLSPSKRPSEVRGR